MFCLIWGGGLLYWRQQILADDEEWAAVYNPNEDQTKSTDDERERDLETITRKVVVIGSIIVFLVLIYPIREMARAHLNDRQIFPEAAVQNHLLTTFFIGMSILGPCTYLVTESSICVLVKDSDNCAALTEISTLVETHLLFSLVFFQTYGFLFEERTVEDLATLTDIKLEEMAVFGIFILNSIVAALVFGMRPRDVDDFDLSDERYVKEFPSFASYTDPTIGFAEGGQYIVLYSWFVIFFFQGYSLRQAVKKEFLKRSSSRPDDLERSVRNLTEPDNTGLDRETWTPSPSLGDRFSVESAKYKVRTKIRQKKKQAVWRLKYVRDALTRRDDEDPCIAAVYRWMLLFIGFSRFMLWSTGFILGALGDIHSVTWITVLNADLFEVSGFCTIVYLFSDLREGSKYKQMLVAVSIPFGYIVQIFFNSSFHPGGFEAGFFSKPTLRSVAYAFFTAYATSRMYMASINIIRDVRKEVLKDIVSIMAFGSIFTYLLPMAYVVTEHVACVWRIYEVETGIFDRPDVWEADILCTSVHYGVKALVFHLGGTGVFVLMFSPKVSETETMRETLFRVPSRARQADMRPCLPPPSCSGWTSIAPTM